ncbi:MAG: polyhydroxyalkanoate synthesis repressor PhaR [Pseudomonadota bacterium]
MAKKNDTDGPVIIKKYANRRLYDTSTSSYVTLEHLSDLVRRGVDFEVRDAKSGEDLTRSVLTQIIFEKENKGEGALPLGFLRKLIGFYGGGPQALLPAWLEMSMNSFAESQERWSKAVTGNVSPFSLFEKQARANMQMFEQAMKMWTPGMTSAKPDDAGANSSKREAPPTDPMSILQQQMRAMQEQLDALAKK